MAAVSQTLIEFARRILPLPAPGVSWDVTDERVLRLHPNFPIAGPNLCGEIRTSPERVIALVGEVRDQFGRAGLPCMWVIDEDTRPADLAQRLLTMGFEETAATLCVVRPAATGPITADPAIQVEDGLASLEVFLEAARAQGAAFGEGEKNPHQAERFRELREQPGTHLLLARLDGRPAGAGSAVVTQAGTLLQGGGVHPSFRHRGVYRALVSARQRLAEAASSPGLASHPRVDTSAPILLRLGFQPVGRRRYFQDPALSSPRPHRR